MDLEYGRDARHRFDYYPPPGDAQAGPLLVWAHGGAWRSEDKADYADLARTLVRRTACPVAVPNYRLTSPQDPIQHPAHASDLLRFLHFLLRAPQHAHELPRAPPAGLVLIGHSCSAHMLSSILLSGPFPELEPTPQLLAATQAVIVSEGIYDVDALLRSFPDYKQWFIANAFGDRAAYPDVNVASYPLRPGTEHIHWLVLHSKADVLVDQLQSETFFAHLLSLKANVSKNFDDLNENHNDLLHSDVYAQIVADFTAAVRAPPAVAAETPIS
ncbi:alpha/beta-hydrolase [Lentinus brumalis]|uniref:Alpha/beta-hydrolase n=1 Tax=Lentinus brumalis TaxID=2498619 RepID=A0A371DVQ7_9APHY|nr:alpha/beta-hydrolase [Polyporus brumalis]